MNLRKEFIRVRGDILAVVFMPSSLPSSYIQAGAKPPQNLYAQQQEKRESAQAPGSGGGGGMGSLPLIIAIIALGISILSLYTVYTAEKPLTVSQKVAIAGIADDLKTLQNKDVSLYAPVQTKLTLNNSYPVRDLFPATFNIPLEFTIPLDTEVVGLSSTGQPVRFKLEEDVPVKTVVQVSAAKAFGNSTIKMDKDLPIDVELYSNVKIMSAYRQELSSIIDRLDALSGATVAQ